MTVNVRSLSESMQVRIVIPVLPFRLPRSEVSVPLYFLQIVVRGEVPAE